jgi:hypothetical protein
MSNLNQFTIPQLKKIIYSTDLSKKIKMSVTRPELIKQMDKYIHFDGYNFHILDSDEDKFLKSDLLKKPPKKKNKRPDLSLTDIQDINKKTVEINDYIKNKIEELKLLNKSFKKEDTIEQKQPKIKIKNKRPNIIKEELFEF